MTSDSVNSIAPSVAQWYFLFKRYSSLVAAASTEFSERLTLDLTSHRTAAVQAALTRDVPVSLAVLAGAEYGDIF